MTWCRQDLFIYLFRYRPHLVILSSNDTYVSVPLLSLGSSTVRSNPQQSTCSHCKINRSSWPKKTQISEKKYEAVSNHAYKRSKKTQITFMDKKIDLIINSKFIRLDLQETIALRIKRERGSHLATNYGPEGLQRTTHTSLERHQWTWCTPPWWCLDWIWCFWTLRRLELIFVDSPRVSGILGYL